MGGSWGFRHGRLKLYLGALFYWVLGSLFTRPALLRQLSALNGRLLPELTELQTRALESELRHARGKESSAAAIAGLPEKLAGFE